MENRIDEIKTPGQQVVVTQYCRQKHPAPPVPKLDFVDPFAGNIEMQVANATDPRYTAARAKIKALTVLQIVRDRDEYGRIYDRVDLTNGNRFPVTSILLAVLPRSAPTCDWNAKTYREVYECDGNANAGLTGSFRCYVPDNPNRQSDGTCIIGIGITGTPGEIAGDLISP